jgi:hypothetical protein
VELGPVAEAPLAQGVATSLVATPTGFVVLGYDAGSGGTAHFVLGGSADARTWSRLSAGPDGLEFTTLAAGPLGWVASSDEIHGTVTTTELWFSADGVAWEPVADQAGLSTANLSGLEMDPISAGPAGFAIIGQVEEAGSTVSATWVSRDGRTWAEADALHGGDVDRVLVTDGGFVATSGGCCVGPGTAAFSADGRVWRDLAADAGPAFDPDAGQGLIAAVGSTVVILRAGGDGTIEVYRADLADAGDGAAVMWHQDAAVDAEFSGAGLSTMTAGGGSVLVLGYDRGTLAPISWTSRDGIAWDRRALDAALFGGGTPALAAAGGSSAFVAVADRANSAGDVRAQLWRSDDGIAWSDAAGDALGPLPPVATGPCPARPPTAVEDYEVLGHALWPTCFGHTTLTVRGVVADCECGGTTSEGATPSWLLDPLGFSAFYLRGPIVSAATGGGGFGVMIDPSHPVTAPKTGTEVELTGHFDDPASSSCRISPLPGAFGRVRPMAQTVAQCRQAFVVETIRIVRD